MNHIEITVHIPQERLAEFYRAYATFLEVSEEPAESSPPPLQRKARRGSSSSYAPLGDYLSKQRKNTVTLEFSEIESILSRPLPASAYQHRAWWANSESHSQAATWLKQGWRASDLNLEQQTVTLRRSE